uniref:GYF domain-containing protein n=1 Tax=Tetradesmus obliquus TaxID=3088 RepID=A0A383W0N6_TETOB|eukprot:jgi/Sobl393_1/12043/SZX71258.1
MPGQRSAAAVVGRTPPAVPGAVYAAAPIAGSSSSARRPAAVAPPPPAASNGGGLDDAIGVLPGGLQLSAGFAEWCRGQMLLLNGNDSMDMIEVLMGLSSNSEIAECCQEVWQNKPGVSTFVSEFVKRKLAEQNRKPGGKKKKGAAAAAAVPAAAAASSGVSAAGVGMINTATSDSWSKIPKKPGKKGKKGTKLDAAALGFTSSSKFDADVLGDDDE